MTELSCSTYPTAKSSAPSSSFTIKKDINMEPFLFSIADHLFSQGMLTDEFSLDKLYAIVVPHPFGGIRVLHIYGFVGPREMYPPTLPAYPSTCSHFHIRLPEAYNYSIPLRSATMHRGLRNCLPLFNCMLGRHILPTEQWDYGFIRYFGAEEYENIIRGSLTLLSSGVYVASDPRLYEEVPSCFLFLEEVDPTTIIYDKNMP